MKKILSIFLALFIAMKMMAQNPTGVYGDLGLTTSNNLHYGKVVVRPYTNGASVGDVWTLTPTGGYFQASGSGVSASTVSNIVNSATNAVWNYTQYPLALTGTVSQVPWLSLTNALGKAVLETNSTKIPLATATDNNGGSLTNLSEWCTNYVNWIWLTNSNNSETNLISIKIPAGTIKSTSWTQVKLVVGGDTASGTKTVRAYLNANSGVVGGLNVISQGQTTTPNALYFYDWMQTNSVSAGIGGPVNRSWYLTGVNNAYVGITNNFSNDQYFNVTMQNSTAAVTSIIYGVQILIHR